MEHKFGRKKRKGKHSEPRW